MVELQEGVDRVPEEWVVDYEGVRFMDQRGDGACVALDLDSRRCTIYEDRPAVCRQFDRGSALCRSVLIGPAAVRVLEASGLSSNRA